MARLCAPAGRAPFLWIVSTKPLTRSVMSQISIVNIRLKYQRIEKSGLQGVSNLFMGKCSWNVGIKNNEAKHWRMANFRSELELAGRAGLSGKLAMLANVFFHKFNLASRFSWTALLYFVLNYHTRHLVTFWVFSNSCILKWPSCACTT